MIWEFASSRTTSRKPSLSMNLPLPKAFVSLLTTSIPFSICAPVLSHSALLKRTLLSNMASGSSSKCVPITFPLPRQPLPKLPALLLQKMTPNMHLTWSRT
uniref:Uncharacterized protein n=1 Tax=Opuntia streptacantha TaxID=393608 RepID=A0A7C8YWT9_OPUST